MARAIQLGSQATLQAAPNPGVGCCITDRGGRILGEGFSSSFGGPHAEINALQNVPSGSDLSHARLYVTLEPCSHFGKTPPCSRAIAATAIPDVFIGISDPNPLVQGGGIRELQEAGKSVTTGILEAECRVLHRRFLINQQKQRPFIRLKWARSSDGYVAPYREDRHPGTPYWISNRFSRQLAHKLRSEASAILVGAGTASADNPTLDNRNWGGPDPVRLLWDPRARVPSDARLLQPGPPTVVFGKKTGDSKAGRHVAWLPPAPGEDLAETVLNYLKKEGMDSLLIEGGRALWDLFLERDLWDEIWEFTGSKSLGDGLRAPASRGRLAESHNVQGDTLNIYYRD